MGGGAFARLGTVLIAPALALLLASAGVRADEGLEPERPEELADEERDEDGSRWFLYKELVLSGFYSPEGVVGLPPGDRTEDHFELSPRPPGNYIGLEYVQTFSPRAFVNDRVLPSWLPLTAVDLHPRLVFDRMEREGGLDRIEFAPQDFWLRLNPGAMDRLSLRIGQFVIPYGVNPIMAPRQRFLLPLEATDLGLKWDWGVDLKGPLGEYDWEIAATIGSGEGVNSPDWHDDSERSYLFTGRLGAPTYWDLQYGLSFLVGDLPTIRAVSVLDPQAISRWRTSLDGFYKYGTYLMLGAQATFGQDGFTGDEERVSITGGNTADVLGALGWVDWVLPFHRDLRIAFQFESVIRDLSGSGTDDTAAILELGYSILTTVSLMLDYRAELNAAMGEEIHAIFLTFIYYG